MITFKPKMGLYCALPLLLCVACDWEDKAHKGPKEINVESPYSEATPFKLSNTDCALLPALASVKAPCVTEQGQRLKNQHYVSNREPLAPSVLIPLPTRSIQPKGWVKTYLQRQRDGLTGNLDKISNWLRRDNSAWLSADGQGERGWEELPYWLRGYVELGYALDDPKVIKESHFWFNSVIENQRADGNFGPFRKSEDGQDFWSNMVMLFALQSFYEYSEDPRVLGLMSRYFKYQLSVDDNMFLTGYWQFLRGGDNLYSVLWLYNHTGEKWLLDLAQKIHRNTADWKMKNDLPDWHNVNIAQAFREPATYYLLSGKESDVGASYNNFWLIRELFGQVPGGMFGGDEVSRDGYDDPRQAVETCGIVEQMFSNEMMLWITGDSVWADHLEEVAFNMAPATSMPDFKSLRYLTSPNMARSDSEDHSPGINNGGPFMLMSALSSRCCQHNHSFGWPYFNKNLWMATPDNGVAAIGYSASRLTAKVGDGAELVIDSDSHYPFEEDIKLTIGLNRSVSFPLYLRIPGWAKTSVVQINGVTVNTTVEAGSYLRIERQWQSGDQVSIELPMDIKVKRWQKNHNSASVQRGPLTYSLKIDENVRKLDPKDSAIWDSEWQQDVDTQKWAAYEIMPSSPWNYGLVLPKQGLVTDEFTVLKKPWPKDDFPFTLDAVPISIKVKAKQIPNWKIDQFGLVGLLQDSPVASDQATTEVELIPMGAARLRISAFPVIGDDENATQWQDK